MTTIAEGGNILNSSFFAMLFRMKYINRWALMRNTRNENLSEHSLETAMIAHALSIIRNKRFDGNVNPDRAATLALFHDCSEIITGDLPTPIKYHNEKMKFEYKKIESEANKRLLSLLPDDLKEEYSSIFDKNENDLELWPLIKAADKLTALIKCIEEKNMGNKEFISAENASLKALEEMNIPEVKVFIEEFLPSFELTIDEQA